MLEPASQPGVVVVAIGQDQVADHYFLEEVDHWAQPVDSFKATILGIRVVGINRQRSGEIAPDDFIDGEIHIVLGRIVATQFLDGASDSGIRVATGFLTDDFVAVIYREEDEKLEFIPDIFTQLFEGAYILIDFSFGKAALDIEAVLDG